MLSCIERQEFVTLTEMNDYLRVTLVAILSGEVRVTGLIICIYIFDVFALVCLFSFFVMGRYYMDICHNQQFNFMIYAIQGKSGMHPKLTGIFVALSDDLM